MFLLTLNRNLLIMINVLITIFLLDFQEQNQILQGISQSIGQSSTASLPYPPIPSSASAYPQIPSNASSNGPVYPGLGDYMGLELSEDVIRANMPEYLVVPQAPVSFLLNLIL